MKHLSAEARATFKRYTELAAREIDQIEAYMRAMLDQDQDGFREALARLHPGETGRMVCVVLLSKVAARIGTLKRPELAGLPDPERAQAVGEVSWGSFSIFEDLAGRFTSAEAKLLGQRIAPLNAKLHAQTEQFVPGFQSGPTPHAFEDMPAGFGVDEFIASWGEAS